MSYHAQDARRQMLEDIARAVADLAVALACLGEAYELVDEGLADALEEQAFRPVQAAYGRARRALSEFAARHAIEVEPPSEGSSGVRSADPRVYLERTLEAVEHADVAIAELQDSLMPVEVGDRELRDGLAATRELIGPVPGRTRALERGFGR